MSDLSEGQDGDTSTKDAGLSSVKNLDELLDVTDYRRRS
jgi:hypothetical protein